MKQQKKNLRYAKESFSNATSSSNSSDADFTSSIPTKMLPLLQMGPGSLAIAEAASNAIAATQLLTGGRRTSSLKASFQAINLGMQNNEFKLSKDVALVSPTNNVRQPIKRKLKQSKGSRGNSDLNHLPQTKSTRQAKSNKISNLDNDEPRYCVCDGVSHGNMVACDNEICPREWFHYECVGVTVSPKGRWYCPPCQTMMSKRVRKS